MSFIAQWWAFKHCWIVELSFYLKINFESIFTFSFEPIFIPRKRPSNGWVRTTSCTSTWPTLPQRQRALPWPWSGSSGSTTLERKGICAPLMCCLQCNHCSNWTWVVEEILVYGNRLRSTYCREFHYLNLYRPAA